MVRAASGTAVGWWRPRETVLSLNLSEMGAGRRFRSGESGGARRRPGQSEPDGQHRRRSAIGSHLGNYKMQRPIASRNVLRPSVRRPRLQFLLCVVKRAAVSRIERRRAGTIRAANELTAAGVSRLRRWSTIISIRLHPAADLHGALLRLVCSRGSWSLPR